MATKQSGAVLVTIPPVPECCGKCGRSFNGRVDSPFGPWAVPVLGKDGWACTYCSESGKGALSRDSLPEESRIQLERYEATARKGEPKSEGRIRTAINDVPYLFTRNAFGWGVVCLSSPTDRFHRSYQVYTAADGSPLRCSCPHCVETQAWCKHLKEAERLNRESSSASAPATTGDFVLANSYGWRIVFHVSPEGVRVERFHRGQRMTSPAPMSVPEAREYYASLLRFPKSPFTRINGGF